MARIYPFQALRYDTSKVRMEDVVTQPYDKITPEMQQAYYERSKYNLIRVILGKKEPDDTDAFAQLNQPQHNVYTRAAESLTSWRKKSILREEAEPALYGYTQTYQVPGTRQIQERKGFIALGQLYDYADKVVYRHEQTFPKHKSDRLALFKATRAYCEQIYMLYSDPAFTAEKLIFDAGAPADLQITDEYNVIHRVWRLTDPHLINLIVTAMADKKLIIADGHHRYETSVTYMHERAAELGAPGLDAETWEGGSSDFEESPSNRADEPHSLLPHPAFPEAAMMMTFVNMDAPGITILPTHRVVFGLQNFSTEAFLTAAEPYFDITREDSATSPTDEKGVAFLAATRDGNHLLTAKARGHRRPSPRAPPRDHRPPGRARRRPAPPPRPRGPPPPHPRVHRQHREYSLPPQRRGSSPAGARQQSRHRLPHPARDPPAAERHLPVRRRHAAEVHRLLSQTAQRPCHLRSRLDRTSYNHKQSPERFDLHDANPRPPAARRPRSRCPDDAPRLHHSGKTKAKAKGTEVRHPGLQHQPDRA